MILPDTPHKYHVNRAITLEYIQTSNPDIFIQPHSRKQEVNLQRGGGEIAFKKGSMLLGKRFSRFSKNGQFKCMRNTVGKTKKIPKIT